MQLIFPTSVLGTLVNRLAENPTVAKVRLTKDELIAVYDELLASGNANCVLLTGRDRKMVISGREVAVEVTP